MITTSDWEAAAVPLCLSCGREAFRAVNGLCYACLGEKDEVQELRDLCLSGKDLKRPEYRLIWKQEYAEFIKMLLTLLREQHLKFNRKLKIRGWIVRRCEGGRRCIMNLGQGCPCQTPVQRGCPLFRPR